MNMSIVWGIRLLHTWTRFVHVALHQYGNSGPPVQTMPVSFATEIAGKEGVGGLMALLRSGFSTHNASMSHRLPHDVGGRAIQELPSGCDLPGVISLPQLFIGLVSAHDFCQSRRGYLIQLLHGSLIR